ncbi:unnamed protein product [Caretta caretta]
MKHSWQRRQTRAIKRQTFMQGQEGTAAMLSLEGAESPLPLQLLAFQWNRKGKLPDPLLKLEEEKAGKGLNIELQIPKADKKIKLQIYNQ